MVGGGAAAGGGDARRPAAIRGADVAGPQAVALTDAGVLGPAGPSASSCSPFLSCSLQASIQVDLVFLRLVWLYQDLCLSNNLVSAILRWLVNPKLRHIKDDYQFCNLQGYITDTHYSARSSTNIFRGSRLSSPCWPSTRYISLATCSSQPNPRKKIDCNISNEVMQVMHVEPPGNKRPVGGRGRRWGVRSHSRSNR